MLVWSAHPIGDDEKQNALEATRAAWLECVSMHGGGHALCLQLLAIIAGLMRCLGQTATALDFVMQMTHEGMDPFFYYPKSGQVDNDDPEQV